MRRFATRGQSAGTQTYTLRSRIWDVDVAGSNPVTPTTEFFTGTRLRFQFSAARGSRNGSSFRAVKSREISAVLGCQRTTETAQGRCAQSVPRHLSGLCSAIIRRGCRSGR
jgi:hypothetical protein